MIEISGAARTRAAAAGAEHARRRLHAVPPGDRQRLVNPPPMPFSLRYLVRHPSSQEGSPQNPDLISKFAMFAMFAMLSVWPKYRSTKKFASSLYLSNWVYRQCLANPLPMLLPLRFFGPTFQFLGIQSRFRGSPRCNQFAQNTDRPRKYIS